MSGPDTDTKQPIIETRWPRIESQPPATPPLNHLPITDTYWRSQTDPWRIMQNLCYRTTLRAWTLSLYTQLTSAGVCGHPPGQLPAIMIGGVSETGSSTWESGYMTMGVPESQIEFIGNGRSKTILSVDHCFVQSNSKRKATRDRFKWHSNLALDDNSYHPK